MSAIVLLLTSTNTPPIMILFAMLLLLLPSSQSAVQVMNYLTTALLRPEILPKLDFSKDVPEDCTTSGRRARIAVEQEASRTSGQEP